MAVDIGPKIGIDGEKEYRQEINSIITQAKTLSSEMRAVTSSFDKNTTAEEKATKVSEVLTKQIQTQEKRVDLLKSMLEKSKEATGENSEQTLKWQQAVNNATAELNTMRTKLTDLNSGLEDTEESMQDVGEKTDDAGQKALSFGDIVKGNVVSDAIIKGFDALKDAVGKLAEAFKEVALGSAQYADDIATMSVITGLSTDTLQEFTYMAELVDTSVSTITGSMTKLTKTMASAQDGSKTAKESFKELGVEFANADGSLRSTEDVFYDVIGALGNVSNEAELDALAMSVFGKSAKDLKPLIDAGADGIEAFRKEAHEMGFVLSDEQLGALLEVSDGYERFKNQITTVKNQLGAGLAPVMEKVFGAMRKWISAINWEAVGEQIGGLLDGVVETLTSVDISEVISNVANGIGEFISAISSFDFTGFFQSVQSTMQFVSEYGPIIVKAISAIGAVIAGLKLGALATTFLPAVSGAIGALAGPIGIAIGAITAISLVVTNWGTISEKATELWNTAKEAIGTIFNQLKDKVSAIVETMKNAIQQKFTALKEKVVTIGTNIKDGFTDAIVALKDGIGSKVTAVKDTIVNGIQGALDFISGIPAKMLNWGSDMMNNLVSGIKSKLGSVGDAISGVANKIASFLHFSEPDVGALSNFHTWMPDFMKGLAEGIDDNSYLVENAIGRLAERMTLDGEQTSVNYGGVVVNLNVPQGTDGRQLVDQIEQELTQRLIRRKAVYQ